MIHANGTGIIKAAKYDADHSPPTSAKVMNACSIIFCLDTHMQYHPPTLKVWLLQLKHIPTPSSCPHLPDSPYEHTSIIIISSSSSSSSRTPSANYQPSKPLLWIMSMVHEW